MIAVDYIMSLVCSGCTLMLALADSLLSSTYKSAAFTKVATLTYVDAGTRPFRALFPYISDNTYEYYNVIPLACS